jgi:hypothetical protein
MLDSIYSDAIGRQGRSPLVISSALKSAEAWGAVISEFLTPDRRQVARAARLSVRPSLYLWLLLADCACVCVCLLPVAVSMGSCRFQELVAHAG